MRVDEVFKQAASQGTAPVSFEMFPPKGELTLDTAREVAGNLCKLSPSFVSVTCSAGGSGNGATTAPIAHMISSEFDTPSVAHLTCVGRSHADIAAKIDEYRTAGVENILALRGDLPAGATEDDKPASDYVYARDLIPELVDAGFCVGAAAYPEGHIACRSLEADISFLKQKQDNGADFIISQLCWDMEQFKYWLDAIREAGVTMPVDVGVMPILDQAATINMALSRNGCVMDSELCRLISRNWLFPNPFNAKDADGKPFDMFYEDKVKRFKEEGIEYTIRQIDEYRALGVDGIHLYALNKWKDVSEIIDRSGLRTLI